MVTHWESSRRPLFVKTVWRDGQHHVVLHKDEDSDTRRTTTSTQHTSRTVRSASKAASNLKAVKLLLAGVGSFSCGEKKRIRCKSSGVKVTERSEAWTILPQRPVTSKTRIKEGLNAATKNLNLCIKSNSIDLDCGRDKVGGVTPFFSCSNYVDQFNNSLSERVMIWLDLATHSGNYIRDIDNAVDCQRIVTTCHVTQKRQQPGVTHKSLANYHFNSDYDLSRTMHVAGTSHALQSNDLSALRRCPSRGARHRTENLAATESTDDSDGPQLSSVVETKALFPGRVQEHLPKPNKISTIKRQLHIFMPNLPKKFSDCDSSILSSKISSCSLQRSVNFRKL